MANKYFDERGEHCRIYVDVLDSPAFLALTWMQRSLYLALSRKRTSFNNGNIEATLADLKRVGFTSSASLASGLRALQAVGLIARTRDGHFSQGSRACNLYRFTDHCVYERKKPILPAMKPTNEWRAFTSIQEAEAAVRAANAAARTNKPRGYPVQRRRCPTPARNLVAVPASNEPLGQSLSFGTR